jgi:hypothetical protein
MRRKRRRRKRKGGGEERRYGRSKREGKKDMERRKIGL